jgi:hypothetical protein
MFCPKCGTQLPRVAIFCKKCGYNIQDKGKLEEIKEIKKPKKNLKIILFLSLGGILLFIGIIIKYIPRIPQTKQNIPSYTEYELAEIKRKFEGKEKELKKVEEELKKMEQEKSSLQYTMDFIKHIQIDNTLQEYYDNVRYYIGIKFGGWRHIIFGDLLGDKNVATRFQAKLAAHDIGLRSKYWREVEDRLEARYYQTTSGHYSYIDARRKIDKVIEYIGIGEHETDEKKIRKILNFVKESVRYKPDFDEIQRAPLETLNLSGDCDDFSILVAALFRRVGINSAIASFKSKTGGPHHAMVLFQSKESLPCYSYSDLSQFELEQGRWYLIEPQERFDKQNDPESFEKWIIEAAASISQVIQE